MTSWLSHPPFVAYAIACVVLILNLMFLWFASAFVRAKSKTTSNPEDAALFKTALVPTDPPAVARVLRAHENAQANIYPFLFLGLVFVLAGGGTTAADWLFGIFTVARLLHTAAYLLKLPPWRTIVFLVGTLCLFALMIDIVVLLSRS